MTIISLEGSRRSGKTYVTKALQNIMKGRAQFFPTEEETRWLWKNSPPMPKDLESLRKNQMWYLRQTENKYNAAADPDKIYIFQRDYLSHLSFCHAFAKTFGMGIFEEIQDYCMDKLEKGIFKKPDLRIVFDNNLETFLERAKKTYEKKIEDLWSHQKFAEHLFEYYRTFTKNNEPEISHLISECSPLPKILDKINQNFPLYSNKG